MIRTLVKPFAASRTPRVQVAAVGKHPAWDDHIDDIGLATPELVQARRTFYAEALAGNVDSTSWGAPDQPAPDWVIAFGHALLWRTAPATWIAGRLWPSRDGRHRTRYPMIVLAQCDNLPLTWITGVALPRLERLQQACSEAEQQAQVAAAVAACQQELAAAAAGAAPEDEPAATRLALERILAGPLAEGTRTALYRAQYQIERELTGAAAVPSRAGSAGVRGRHIRLPALADAPHESLALWARYLGAQLPLADQLLLLAPLNHGWVDVIAGSLDAATLAPLRIGAERMPPASEVPYTLDDAFLRRAEALMATLRTRGVLGAEAASAASANAGPAAPNAVTNPGAAASPSSPASPRGASATHADSSPTSTPANAAAGATRRPDRSEPTTFGAPAPRRARAWIGVGIALLLLAVAALIASLSGLFSTVQQTAPPRPTPGAMETVPTPPKNGAPAAPDNGHPIPVPGPHDPPVTTPPAPPSTPTAPASAPAPTASTPTPPSIAPAPAAPSTTAPSTTPPNAAPSPSAPVHANDFPPRLTSAVPLQTLWAEQLRVFSSLEPTPPRTARLAALQSAIESIDRALVPMASMNLPTTALSREIEKLEASRRTTLLNDAAQKLGDTRADPARAAPALLAGVEAHNRWLTEAAAFARSADRVALALGAGLAWNDRLSGEGETLAVAATRITKDAPAELVALAPDVVTPLAAVQNVAVATDGAALVGALIAPGSSASVIRTAADRLGELAPQSPLQGQLAALAPSLPALRPRLNAEREAGLGVLARAEWLNEFAAATQSQATALIALLPALGMAPESLPAWARFNLARRAFAAAVADERLSDAETQKAANAFVAALTPLAGSPALTGAAPALLRLRELAAATAAPALTAADLPPAQAAPGRATLIPDPAGPAENGAITYTLTAEGVAPQQITFVPLQVAGKTSYLASTETSVALAAALISAASAETALVRLTPDWNVLATRRGVHVWEPSKTSTKKPPFTPAAALGPLKGWFTIPPGAGTTSLLAEPDAPAPQWTLPMQGMTPDAAALVAACAGCRLPTVAEWQAARAFEGITDTPQALAGMQLRGQRWKKQHDTAKAARAGGVNMAFPGDGAFSPASVPAPSPEADTAALDLTEPAFLFAPVDSGPGKSFKHLIGNAAEWVVVDAAKFDALTPAAIKLKTVNVAQDLRVIGGSSLSNPATPRTTPLAAEPTRAAQGYVDVGFRLAFSAERGVPRNVLAAQAREILTQLPAARPSDSRDPGK
ncbi:hypothetical protein BH11PLA1_BH11PLA1_17790 [soil metagenome]